MNNSNINPKKNWFKSALSFVAKVIILIAASLIVIGIISSKMEENEQDKRKIYPVRSFEYTEEEIAKHDSLINVFRELMCK